MHSYKCRPSGTYLNTMCLFLCTSVATYTQVNCFYKHIKKVQESCIRGFFFFFLVKYRPNSFSFFKMDKFLPLIILLFMYNQGLSVGIALIVLLSVDNNMHQAYFREILHASVNLVPFLQNIL